MNTLTKLLTATIVLLISHKAADAQNGQRLREPAPDLTTTIGDPCHRCDSLANSYLQAGDTSMAIYYYQQYVDAHPEDIDHKNMLLHQVRMYNRRQSFYLSDH